MNVFMNSTNLNFLKFAILELSGVKEPTHPLTNEIDRLKDEVEIIKPATLPKAKL